MKLIKHSILALALFSGIGYQQTYAAPAVQYEQTLNIDTLTWEQIDAGARSLLLQIMANTVEAMANIVENRLSPELTKDDVIAILEQGIIVDTSSLSGEYKSYMEASMPITKKMIDDIKLLPDGTDYETAIQAVRDKYQPEIEVINRTHPNAAIVFDTQDPIKQAKIQQIMMEGSNCQAILMKALMTSSSENEAMRKAADELRKEAAKQK